MRNVGVVVIGRNEGERLRRCLASVHARSACTVYVDSGSTDGSIDLARAMGVEVLDLDCTVPFSAARARNEGFARLQQMAPAIEFVQFVDGDCELFDDWLEHATTALASRPDAAAVAGRLREADTAASVYNRMCDIEWDTPVGDVREIGGIAMIRVHPFRDANGFDSTLIAGEEPELCFRLRAAGWKILRIDADMAKHDAAMTRFAQWWRRAVRSGHAYAEGASRHGNSPERYWVRETRSILFWGIGLPIGIIAASTAIHPAALLLLAGYLLLTARVYRHMRHRAICPPDSLAYAAFCTLAKFPQAIGLAAFHRRRLTGGKHRIIEYK